MVLYLNLMLKKLKVTNNLERFTLAQDPVIDEVEQELISGLKKTHWMWFIFPNIYGLGKSEKSIFYSIKDMDEAREYLKHPILRKRLIICLSLLCVSGNYFNEIFNEVDLMKLNSCLTLFLYASHDDIKLNNFLRLVSHYFDNDCYKTIDIISLDKENNL